MAGRIKVVFASLLKPVDEPRMYHKLGRSLAQTYKYDVNIIGYESKNLPTDPLITFWPLFNFPRISIARALAPLRLFKKLLHLKPELIIVNSPDLFIVTALYKILFGCHIIYDLQENNYRNIIWSHAQPSFSRRLRAAIIRGMELCYDRIVIRYALAEHCYLTECSFINKPYILLQNKARKPDEQIYTIASKVIQPQSLRLLYAGTIAASYGILDTFKVADAIHKLFPGCTYTICGHSPAADIQLRLMQEAEQRPWVKLMISPTPIPHNTILSELKKAHFTFVAYRLNPANTGSMPTRIWEALAWKTPVILRREHPWTTWIESQDAGFAIDFQEPDPTELIQHISGRQYFSKPLPESIYWESIEGQWTQMVDDLFQSTPLNPLF